MASPYEMALEEVRKLKLEVDKLRKCTKLGECERCYLGAEICTDCALHNLYEENKALREILEPVVRCVWYQRCKVETVLAHSLRLGEIVCEAQEKFRKWEAQKNARV